MSNVEITIQLPEELLQRAKNVGVELESQTDQIVELLEAQIWKREAAQSLRQIARQIDALPAESKPTPEEIQAEIQAYWAEQTHDNSSQNLFSKQRRFMISLSRELWNKSPP